MNIFKLMQAMRPYIQRGDMTYDLAVKYLKERGVQFDGIVKKALDNMFKKIKARDPVFDKSVTKMPIDDAGTPFNPNTLKSTTEKRGVENLFQETKKVNIPADKLNHQMIADQAGIEVELIKGKDWVEILEVLKGLKKADGGRVDLYRGGSPGDTHNNPSRGGFDYESEAYGAPDTIASITRHSGGGGDSGGGGGGGANLNLSPVVTYTPSNQIEKVGLQGNLGKLMAAGVIDLEDALTTGNIDPTTAAALNLGNFNLSGIKSPDQEGIFAQGNIGPVNVGGSYQDFGDSGIAKNIGASGMLGNLGMGVNYDFESNPNLGLSYNNPDAGLKGGVTYNLGGKPEGIISFSKKFKKGGRVGFQQGGAYDSRASVSDFAKALWNVGGGDQAQLQNDLRRYTTNVVSNLQNQLNQSTRRNYPTYEQAVQARNEEKNIQDKISRARYESARGMKNPNFRIDYDKFDDAYRQNLLRKYSNPEMQKLVEPYENRFSMAPEFIDDGTGKMIKNTFTDRYGKPITRAEELSNRINQLYVSDLGTPVEYDYLGTIKNLENLLKSEDAKQMLKFEQSMPGYKPRTLGSEIESKLSDLKIAQRNRLARENARRYDELMVQTQPGYARNVEAYNRRHSGNWLNKALAPNQSMSDYLTQAGDVYGLTTDQLWNYRAPAYKAPEPYTYKKYVPGIMASSTLNKSQAERMGYNPMTGDFRGIEGIGIGERNEYGAPIPVAPPLSNEFTDPYEGLSGQEYAEKYGIPYGAGGRVGYDIGGLTGQAKNIYDSWISAGHSSQDALDYLSSRGMYNAGSGGIESIVNTQQSIIPQSGGGGNETWDPNTAQTKMFNKDVWTEISPGLYDWVNTEIEGFLSPTGWKTAQGKNIQHAGLYGIRPMFSYLFDRGAPYNPGGKYRPGSIKGAWQEREDRIKLEQAAEEQQRQETARQIAAAAQAFQSTGDYDEFSGAGGNVDPGGPASRMDWSALTDDEGDKYATGGVATMFTRRR